MANNRLWLVYRPTGKAVFLGKRMAEGWYNVPDDVKERIEALFQHIQDERGNREYEQDDMTLAMEECEGRSPFVNVNWRYTETGVGKPLSQLEMSPDGVAA